MDAVKTLMVVLTVLIRCYVASKSADHLVQSTDVPGKTRLVESSSVC